MSQWDLYIGQFKGNSPTDYTKIKTRLKARLHADTLPDNYDESLAKDITAYALRAAAREQIVDVEELEEDTRHKIGRDGRLIASVFAARQSSAEVEGARPMVILSSSHILLKAERKFGERLGGKPIVLSKAGFTYLLSMISEIQVGADTLRRALFEFGKAAKLTDVQRRALRIIRSSGAFDLPWADRGLLQTQISLSIHKEAAKLGVTDQWLKSKISSSTAPESSAKVIADALRNMAKGTVNEEQLQRAQQRILQLETDLAETQSALKKAMSKVQPS